MSLYVGRTVDPDGFRPLGYALVEPESLTRHAVCVGMTGSGKTGLCVALLEELAMAGVPLFVIDPKGDVANLALAFREPTAEAFAPWVDPKDDPAATARKWQEQLAAWQVGADRVQALTEGAKVTIFTPGSTSGVPVDVLGTIAAPPEGALDDEETLQDLVGGSVSSLLGLVGVRADPLSDPAHVVLSAIVDAAWRAGEPLDVGTLVTRLVDPPFAKVGVFPVDTFYPRKDRLALAMQLNALVASPAFAPWSQGVALDPDALIRPVDGKTPVNVFFLAHLDEPRREFFVSQLLHRLVAWSRRQPGSSSLRALVYFDEVYGYLPPYPKNPPAKKPVLTLMKQARAVGVGTVLVTQNPVDVDYAALSNAGTWLVGRLQTQQDREKVVEGLVGAGVGADPKQLDEAIARLPARTFVVREAGKPQPELVASRQTISFLRGPLTKKEVERLRPPGALPTPPAGPPVPGRRPQATATSSGATSSGTSSGQTSSGTSSGTTSSGTSSGATSFGATAAGGAGTAVPAGHTTSPPPAPEGYAFHWLDPGVVFSPRLGQYFGSAAKPARDDGRVVWEPALYARLRLVFEQGREFRFERDEHRLFFPIGRDLRVCTEPAFEDGDLSDVAPDGPALYAPIPAHVDEAKELKALEKRVLDDVLRGETEKMWRHRGLRLESRAGETKDAFLERVDRALDDKADAEIGKLKEKVEKDVARIEDKRTRLQRDLQRHQENASSRQINEVVNAGETILGLFFGRRRVTTSVSSAVSRHSQTSAAQTRVSQTQEELGGIDREIYELEVATEDKIREIRSKWHAQRDDLEEVAVRLDRNDVRLDQFGIVWVPVTRAV